MGCANGVRVSHTVRTAEGVCEFRTPFARLRGCASFAQAWSSFLPKAISSSFQLQIVHGLKRWILDFLSFEMTPEQNSVPECKNHFSLETTHALLLGAHVPSSHWLDVVMIVMHLINRMPSWILGFKTPLQALAAALCYYGCHLPRVRDVLSSIQFFSSGETQNEELNWFKDIPLTIEPPTTMDMEQTIETPTPTIETPTSIVETPSHSTILHDPTSENIPEEIPDISFPFVTKHLTDDGYQLPPRHNHGKPPEYYSPYIKTHKSKYPIANYVSTEKLSKPLKSFSNELSVHHIPTSIDEALQDPKWVQAMKEEIEALLKNKTWILVPLQEGHKTVGYKWVFSIEYKRAKLNTVRVLLSLATNLDWPLYSNLMLGEYPDQIPIDKGKYRRLVGKLIYLSHTRPDIAYAVSVARNHRERNYVLKEWAPGNYGVYDADWVGNISDRKSTSGYFTFVGGNLVTWRSKKQKVVALSSAKSKVSRNG
ncbi:putative mitochondrial protein [Vitis vinifera]|uniref:Putative mitochondrial protein n=1 Tax=Vitis vinifera TaxID=29760 RepID=A0A438DIK9_VITVI|nr:putative mitochondrial protein [Vitis vinifera]